MSETKQKPWTGTPECGDPEHFYNSETGYVECNTCSRPAEPVIEVAPDEPTCEYCGPECYGGAAHNIRVEDRARYTDDPVRAQEAPREDMCEGCGLEPSVGASADDVLLCQECLDLPGDEALIPAEDDLEGQVQFNERRIESLETALAHIANYAREAAKTPITREDMHDPLKAQTFYDEAKGFERLVLSEIGVGSEQTQSVYVSVPRVWILRLLRRNGDRYLLRQPRN